MRKSMIAAALTAVVVLAAATGAGAATAPSPSYTVAGLATVHAAGKHDVAHRIRHRFDR